MAAGSLLLYAGITGRSVPAALQAIIRGKSPATAARTAGIGQVVQTAAESSDPSGTALLRGNGGTDIPDLGTTLPPESTMIKYFGQPGDSSQEVTVPFAGRTVQINKVLAANVISLGAKLTTAGYNSYIRDVGGFRTSVGASGSPIPFSMHQFGAAFDINEDGGPDGNWNTMTLPAGLVSTCASMNWFCGENWPGASRDGGHFQFTGG
jgi:D-alanyl-D-alanine carboxypeptidase